MSYEALFDLMMAANAEADRLSQLLVFERVQVMAPVVQELRDAGYRVEFVDENGATMPDEWARVNKECVAPGAWRVRAWRGRKCIGEIEWNWGTARPLEYYTPELERFV